jgi:alpha-N-arabinofuranosidase
MNRPSVRCVVVLAVLLALTLTGAATASAAARHRSHPARLALSGRERVLVHRAGSLAIAGVRTASTGANKHVVPPKKKKKKKTKKKKPTPVPTPTPPAPAPVPNVPAPPTAISVDTTTPGTAISPALFGSDFLAPDAGMGSADATGTFSPSFLSQLTTQVGAGSLRFPGGITAQAYQWMDAIGPQGSREPNPVGPNGRPSASPSVGPDELGKLLDLTGASGVVDVDFADGNAVEAANFVHYMTDATGSSPLADERATNGHPAPYNVPYWEVGNEEQNLSQQTPAQQQQQLAQSWRAGTWVSYAGAPVGSCPNQVTCEYIYGGTTSFTNQQVVGAPGSGDRSPTSAVSAGTADEEFQVAFPPVSSASPAKVMVAGTQWTPVGSLNGVGSAQDYLLNSSTGTITFGDNAGNGKIPPSGDTVTATYDSGPHDGFNAFYSAMTRANPNINVCATQTSTNFLTAMGSQPYDCLQDHPYVGTGTGGISASLPIDQYESQVMAVPDVTEVAAVQTLESQVLQASGKNIPLVLTEYGQLINATPDPMETDATYYLNSLDEALVNASQLADWIKLGIPVADRQLLDAELPSPDPLNTSFVTAGLPGAAPFAATGAITTPGPFSTATQTIVQPTGLFLGLMSPLAGGSQLNTAMSGNPVLTTLGSTSVGDLSTVSAATTSGVQLIVINRSPTADVPSSVAFSGVTASGTATVTTLDGPSPLSDNTAAAPTTVTTSTSTASVTAGATVVNFPAHSISLVTLRGA